MIRVSLALLTLSFVGCSDVPAIDDGRNPDSGVDSMRAPPLIWLTTTPAAVPESDGGGFLGAVVEPGRPTPRVGLLVRRTDDGSTGFGLATVTLYGYYDDASLGETPIVSVVAQPAADVYISELADGGRFRFFRAQYAFDCYDGLSDGHGLLEAALIVDEAPSARPGPYSMLVWDDTRSLSLESDSDVITLPEGFGRIGWRLQLSDVTNGGNSISYALYDADTNTEISASTAHDAKTVEVIAAEEVTTRRVFIRRTPTGAFLARARIWITAMACACSTATGGGGGAAAAFQSNPVTDGVTFEGSVGFAGYVQFSEPPYIGALTLGDYILFILNQGGS